MPEVATVTPAEIRAYANLPSEVPGDLLSKHIEIAQRDLVKASGVAVAPEGHEQEWIEALTVRALASAFTWLNTFALDGAAKVGRLEGSVQYRFLDAEDVEKKCETLNNRFDELVAKMPQPDADDEMPDQVGLGITSLMVI
jgi:hypothetical protein